MFSENKIKIVGLLLWLLSDCGKIEVLGRRRIKDCLLKKHFNHLNLKLIKNKFSIFHVFLYLFSFYLLRNGLSISSLSVDLWQSFDGFLACWTFLFLQRAYYWWIRSIILRYQLTACLFHIFFIVLALFVLTY